MAGQPNVSVRKALVEIKISHTNWKCVRTRQTNKIICERHTIIVNHNRAFENNRLAACFYVCKSRFNQIIQKQASSGYFLGRYITFIHYNVRVGIIPYRHGVRVKTPTVDLMYTDHGMWLNISGNGRKNINFLRVRFEILVVHCIGSK